MKKILFFIAIASFTTIGFTSCTEEDYYTEIPTPNTNPNLGEQLRVVPNATFITLGNSVTLKAYSGTTQISDATFYVDDVAISGNTYKHSTIASVKIMAKRPGYVDSETIYVRFAQK